MNDLQIFQNDEFGQIRTLTINEEPWFVGKDVALSLGYSNPRKAIIDHVDDDDKGVTNRDTLGGTQQIVIINESGLYSLIFGSKLDSAKRFKRWVTSEVLPTIRKTGSYSTKVSQTDILQAARIVASCKPDRLQLVLNLLQQAGLPVSIPHGHINVDITEIDRLMTGCKVSLCELSRRTGIPKSSLSYYRRGIHKPSEERYQIIVNAITL